MTTEIDPRIKAKREQVHQLEETHPLQRSILILLSKKEHVYGLSDKEIAELLATSQVTVQDETSRMYQEGLLLKADRLYSLTGSGIHRLNDHFAFGAPETPLPPPTFEEEVRFLREAMANAAFFCTIAEKRAMGIERLNLIREQAEELGASDLANEASDLIKQHERY